MKNINFTIVDLTEDDVDHQIFNESLMMWESNKDLCNDLWQNIYQIKDKTNES